MPATQRLNHDDYGLDLGRLRVGYTSIVDADIAKTSQGKYALRVVYFTGEDIEVLGRKTKRSVELTISDLEKYEATQVVDALRSHQVGVTDYSGGEFNPHAQNPQTQHHPHPP